MPGKHCRLYDEQLVKNIMASTGRYLLDYLKENPVVNEQELLDFIEANADDIIGSSLDEMHEDDAPAEDDEALEGNEWGGAGPAPDKE
jgi:hypothetical protein